MRNVIKIIIIVLAALSLMNLSIAFGIGAISSDRQNYLKDKAMDFEPNTQGFLQQKREWAQFSEKWAPIFCKIAAIPFFLLMIILLIIYVPKLCGIVFEKLETLHQSTFPNARRFYKITVCSIFKSHSFWHFVL